MGETRKLAAILVADIVGYSRLAGTDEDRTLSRLRGLRSDLIDPAIDAHHGRIVKRTSWPPLRRGSGAVRHDLSPPPPYAASGRRGSLGGAGRGKFIMMSTTANALCASLRVLTSMATISAASRRS